MKRFGEIMMVTLVVRAAAAGEPAALWDLAPPDTAWAVVVRDGALASLRRGWEAIAAEDAVVASLADDLPAVLRSCEIDDRRGLAWFHTRRGEDVFVVSVADRSRLRRNAGGLVERKDGRTLDRFDDFLCGEQRGRHACATAASLLDELGAGGALAAEVASWPPELRGDVEAWAAEGTLPVTRGATLRASARLVHGGVTLRAQLPGPRSPPPAPSPLEAHLADLRPTAFVVTRSWPVHWGWGRDLLGAVADVWDGDLVAYALAGRPWRAIVKAGVRDERSARALVRRDARWRLANGVLIAGIGQPGYAAEAPELSPEALDVLDRGLSLAAWGRGAESAGLLASHLPLDRLDPRLAAAARRLLRHLAEAGIAFGVDDAGVEAVIHIRTTLGPR